MIIPRSLIQHPKGVVVGAITGVPQYMCTGIGILQVLRAQGEQVWIDEQARVLTVGASEQVIEIAAGQVRSRPNGGGIHHIDWMAASILGICFDGNIVFGADCITSLLNGVTRAEFCNYLAEYWLMMFDNAVEDAHGLLDVGDVMAAYFNLKRAVDVLADYRAVLSNRGLPSLFIGQLGTAQRQDDEEIGKIYSKIVDRGFEAYSSLSEADASESIRELLFRCADLCLHTQLKRAKLI